MKGIPGMIFPYYPPLMTFLAAGANKVASDSSLANLTGSRQEKKRGLIVVMFYGKRIESSAIPGAVMQLRLTIKSAGGVICL
jgi:hypothetical protein